MQKRECENLFGSIEMVIICKRQNVKTFMVEWKWSYIEGSRPEWYISSM